MKKHTLIMDGYGTDYGYYYHSSDPIIRKKFILQVFTLPEAPANLTMEIHSTPRKGAVKITRIKDLTEWDMDHMIHVHCFHSHGESDPITCEFAYYLRNNNLPRTVWLYFPGLTFSGNKFTLSTKSTKMTKEENIVAFREWWFSAPSTKKLIELAGADVAEKAWGHILKWWDIELSREKPFTLPNAELDGMFAWTNTPEGHAYWSDLDYKVRGAFNHE